MSLRRSLSIILPLVVAAALPTLRTARAGDDATERNERCAIRLSAALLGRGPTAELLASTTPQASVDQLLEDPQLVERLSRFLNASFNSRPGDSAKEDATYYLAKHVLEKKLPYKELFVGKYDVDAAADGNVVVKEDPGGLGYFRSLPWLRRYAGNEQTGLKISTAYRMMNNTVGLKLVATTNAPDADVSAKGRAAEPCNGCHFSGWSALDTAAKVLTRRNGAGDQMKFDPPTDGPQEVADKTVANDGELVAALVDSEAFDFNVCRLSFKFLYDRVENACESELFDRCMTEFKAKGTIQAAIGTIAKDAGFCQ